MIYFVIYFLFAVFFHMIISLDILSLESLRISLPVKQRKKVDNDILFLKSCKKISLLWPFAVYKTYSSHGNDRE
mgnify:CR=1 FL=1